MIIGENMDTKFWIAQLVGVIGYSTLGYSFYKKKKKDILLIQIFSYLVFTIHYWLLDGITGSVCNLLGLIAFIIIYFFDLYKKNKKILIAIIIPILIFISLITYQNIYSIFPIIASVISTLAFITDSEDTIRGIGIIGSICWLIYSIVYKSYAAIVFEAITLIVIIIAYFKRRKK